MDNNCVEIVTTQTPDYHALVWSGGWRVALLNDAPRFRMENIKSVQRHNTSDELFVLLTGECTLFAGPAPDKVTSLKMKPGFLYNVKKGVWHNCATTAGTVLLIVENAEVAPENTEEASVNLEEQI